MSGDEAKAVNFQKITSYSEKESQAQRIFSYKGGGAVLEVLLGFPSLADCDANDSMTHPVLSLHQIRPAEHLFFYAVMYGQVERMNKTSTPLAVAEEYSSSFFLCDVSSELLYIP